MATTKNPVAQTLMVKAAFADIIMTLGKTLDDLKKSTTEDYRIVGKLDEQATNWKTGEPLWEDEEHTIPLYRDKWDYVQIPDEELSEEQRARLAAIGLVKVALEHLVSINVVQ